MRVARWVTGLLTLAGVLSQLWIQVDWIGGLSEHCDYPEDCMTRWLPEAFSAAELVWLATSACGLLALAIGWRLGESAGSLALAATGPAIAFMAYFLTETWQWRGDMDGLIQANGPRWDDAYQVALLLLLLSLALQAFVLGRLAMTRIEPTPTRPKTPQRATL